MCGLLGLIVAQGKAHEYEKALYDAGEYMYHRGPDDPGTWHDDDVVFAFNRLATIDIEHSHQPLQWGPADNPDRYAIIFNGEIYNYLELRSELATLGAHFHTEGDAETIVAAWYYYGPETLKKLRGMFAFALWDRQEKKLVLARDPFGIKPLYVATTAVGTVFGSEKKCLLSLAGELGINDQVNPRALSHYTTLQYVPEPESLTTGISRLKSGHYAVIAPGKQPQFHRYFTPVFSAIRRPEEKTHQLIADKLIDSVAMHMRADVTVGSFLSGGIDSTAIAALAIRHNPNLVTFTTGFEREGYSEIDVAAESAAAIGAKHLVKIVSPQEYIEAIPKIVWYLDDPVADPSLVPLYYVAQLARQHVKVVLSGEGADELFGGYTIYKEPLSLRPFELIPGRLRSSLDRLSSVIPDGVRGKSLLHRGSQTLEQRYYGNARSFSDPQLERVLAHYHAEWNHQDITRHIYLQSREFDPVARMQHLDLLTWLRGDILVKADKMTMANSLELRVPFLDKEVFELARTLTVADKISHNTTKYALRQALKKIVPPHVLHRPKLGFPVPIRHWLQGGIVYDWAAEVIEASQTDQYYNKKEVLAMLREHSQGLTDHSRRLWVILMFMIWHAIFVSRTLEPNIEKKVYPVRI